MSKTQKQLEKLVAGDNKAWGEVVKEYYPQILRYLHFHGGSRVVAEDVAEETFFELYRHINQLKKPKAFSSWVLLIARKTLYKHLSLRAREDKIADLHASLMKLDEGEDEMKDEHLRLLEQAILRLSPLQRTVFVLYYYNHMPISEISKIIGSDKTCIKTVLSHGRNMLRRLVEKKVKSGKLK